MSSFVRSFVRSRPQVAFTSLIAVSGASSVVVALACQEPLSHLINGLLLTFNDKFRPGDEIHFGDVKGFCTSMRGPASQVVPPRGERKDAPGSVGVSLSLSLSLVGSARRSPRS